MSGESGLYRAYRHLLRAYPRSYRRSRGTEMLTTLLDAAAPGQRRPSVADAVDLLGGGLRFRVRTPPGVAYRVVAVLVALLGAVVGSAGAAGAAWSAVDTEPSATRAWHVADTAVPGMPVDAGRPIRPDPLRQDVFGFGTAPADDGYTGPAPAVAMVRFAHPAGPSTGAHDPYTAVRQAGSRLTDAGWRVDRPVSHDGGAVGWASKGDLSVRVMALAGTQQPDAGGSWSRGDPVTLWIDVHRAAPAVTTPAAIAGAFGGALLGWLFAAGLLRAYLRHRPRRRAVLLLIGAPALGLATLSVLLPAMIRVTALATAHGWSPHDSLAGAAALRQSWTAAVVAAVAALAASVVAARQPRRAAAPYPDRQPRNRW